MPDKEPIAAAGPSDATVAADATLPAINNTPASVRTPSGGSGGRGGSTPSYQTGDLVAERYKIIKPLGEGGMGEVYEAEDLLLKERVALKTLRDPVADDETSILRFKREIQLARKVTHPNVCRIFDVGLDRRVAGRENAFLTMELLGGETLSARLRREGRMSTAVALPIATQIAGALAAAHAAGIIHRDLKCANVLLEPGGRAVVTDFGLARATAEGSDQVTGDGGIVGSPAYMSPEQVEGGRKLSSAADLYAFGVVLFEMVTGRLPFVGETPLATAVKRVREAPPSPRKHVPDLDERWERAILHCLGRTPEDRPATAGDVIAELRGDSIAAHPEAAALTTAPVRLAPSPSSGRRRRWGLIAIGVAVGVFTLAFALKNRGNRGEIPDPEGPVRIDIRGPEGLEGLPVPPVPPGPPQVVVRTRSGNMVVAGSPRAARRGVAIMGFKNLSGKTEDDYLSTAFAEMLSSELMAGDELRTAPGESVARAKKQLSLAPADSYARDTLARLRRILDADYVVSGSYLVMGGDRVRLDLKLQDTVSGETVGSIAETGEVDELAELVSEVGERLRGELQVDEPSESERMGARALQPRKADVTRLYAEGLAQLRVDNCVAARGPLEQAVAADPTYAQAHEALSEVLYCVGSETRALEEAQRAVELSADLPDDVRLLAEARVQQLTNEWSKAAASYEELFAKNPDNFDYGLRLLRVQSKVSKDKARITLEALRKLQPADDVSAELAMSEAQLMEDQSPEKLLLAARKARELAESQGARLIAATAWLAEAGAFSEQNKWDEAESAADKAKEIFQASGDKDGIALALGYQAVIARRRGDEKKSTALVAEIAEISGQLDSVRRVAGTKSELAGIDAQQGFLEKAEGEFAEVVRLHEKRGARGDAAGATMWMSWLRFLRGDVRRALAIADSAIEELGQVNALELQGLALLSRASMAALLGDDEGARAKLGEAIRANANVGTVGSEAYIEAVIALGEGRNAEAETWMRKIPQDEFRRKTWSAPGELDRMLVEALLGQGKVAEARVIIEKIKDRQTRAPSALMQLDLDIFAARIKATSRKPADLAAAARDLEGPAQRAASMGAVLARLRVELWRGRIEKAAGNNAAAARLLGAVAREAGKRGFVSLARTAGAALSGTVKTF